MKYTKKLNYLFLLFGLLPQLQADSGLSHMCAYSNGSVAKFREKAVNVCMLNSAIYKSKIHFLWPVDLCEFWVSSLFGPRTHHGATKLHKGIDMAALKGTKVKASASGVVTVSTADVPGYGNLIIIRHKGGFETKYGHLLDRLVSVGDRVSADEVIGTVGATGNARGKDPSHLHFEILKDGVQVDPLPYLYCSEKALSNSSET